MKQLNRGFTIRARLLVTLLIVVLLNVTINTYLQIKTDTSLAQINHRIAKTNIEINKIRAEHARKLAIKARRDAATEAATIKLGNKPRAKSSDCNQSIVHIDPNKADVLVNKKHCINPLTYEPSQLVSVNGAEIHSIAKEDFAAMLDAAAQAGLSLRVTSSYRSYDNQLATYNEYLTAANGSWPEADAVCSRPGYSEHQTGLAVDFAAGNCGLHCFSATPQKQWLNQNASKYGFIERYPVGLESVTGYQAESWHYRYVGKKTAENMLQKNIRTLEQYWNLPGGNY